MIDKQQVMAKGHVKIYYVADDNFDEEILLDKDNAIHYENFSEALALSMGNKNSGYIYQMAFGNGGTNVDATGIITYLPPNTVGQSAKLYSQKFSKVVDDSSATNIDPVRNNLTISHTTGKVYTDILVSCILDYGEPAGQQAFDNSTDLNGEFVFDELGLETWMGDVDTLRLITHVIHHPIQKALNRQMQIDYTIRIQALTSMTTSC